MRGYNIEKRLAHVLREGEIGIPVATINIIVKYTANTACLVPVRQVEILVAPFFELWIILRVMRIAGRFEGGVKYRCVGIVGIHRRQIAAAAEPGL